MDTLKPLVDQLAKMIKDGYELGKGELPEVAKQILTYKTFSESMGILWGILGIGAFAAALYGYFIFLRGWAEPKYMDMYPGVMGMKIMGFIVFSIICLIFLTNISCHVHELLEIKLAPKVYLIEYLSGILK